MSGSDVRDDRIAQAMDRAVKGLPVEGDVRVVMRRGSRQRMFRVVGSAATVAVFVGVVIAAAMIVGDRPQDQRPLGTDRYPVFERTADVAGVTITSPSDWFLIDQAHQLSRDPTPGSILPILQLSNFDPGLEEPLCGAELPSEAVALTIATEPYAVELGPQDRRWPTELVDVESSDCGPGKVARFFASVGESSPTYFLWVGFGDDVSDEDRDTVLRAVASLEVALEKRPLYGEGPAYVVAGGTDRGAPWLLEFRPTDVNAEIELLTLDGVSGVGDFTVPAVPIEGTAFGAVTKEADGVEFRPSSGEPPIRATLIQAPPTVRLDADIFLFPGLLPDEPLRGDVVPLGDVATSDDDTGPDDPPVTPYLSEDERWAPDTYREGSSVLMPVTFTNGTTAELVYPADLPRDLAELSVRPSTFAEGPRACGASVDATRHDPSLGWIRGSAPLAVHTRPDGMSVELWQGTRDHAPHDYLVTRVGAWSVLVPCRGAALTPDDFATWAEGLEPIETPEGLLVIGSSGGIAANPYGDIRGAPSIQLSDRDVVVELRSTRRCADDDGDRDPSDGVVQWCIDPQGGIYLYANSFAPSGKELLASLVEGLEVRAVRPA